MFHKGRRRYSLHGLASRSSLQQGTPSILVQSNSSRSLYDLLLAGAPDLFVSAPGRVFFKMVKSCCVAISSSRL